MREEGSRRRRGVLERVLNRRDQPSQPDLRHVKKGEVKG